jgi:hypothetical protein
MIRTFIATLLLFAVMPAAAESFGGNPIPSAVGPDGVSNAPIIAPSFGAPAQDFEFYVNASTGDDSNSCTDPGAPCLTLPAAMAKVPQYWVQGCTMNVAEGTYTLPDAEILSPGFPVRMGWPFHLKGTMVDSGLSTRTISHVDTAGGYVYRVRDDSLTPTEDEYLAHWIRFTSGDATGMVRTIRSNSTDGWFEMQEADFSPAKRPAVGDTFVVEKPGTVIQFQTLTDVAGINLQGVGGANAPWVISNVKIEPSASYTYIYLIGAANICMRSVHIDLGTNSGMVLKDGVALYAGSCNLVLTGNDLRDAAWLLEGDGIYLSGTGRTLSFGNETTFHGYMMSRGVKVSAGSTRLLHFFNLDMADGANIYGHWTHLKFQKQVAPIYGKIDAPPDYGIWIEENSALQYLQYMDISDSTGPGVIVDAGSVAWMKEVTGTGNAGAGVELRGLSKLVAVSNNTLTGTADVKVGSQTATFASIQGGTPLVDVLGGVAYTDSTVLPTLKIAALTVGSSGTSISASVRCTDTLDTASISAGTTVSQSVSCTGAAVGAECSVGGPSTLEAGLVQSCRVSAADTVDLRTANVSASPISPAGSQTVSVRVLNP